MSNRLYRQKKILYIEANVDGTIGGSYYSLLFLTQRLDKTKYSPIVAFYRKNELINQFKEAGCKIIILNPAKPINLVSQFAQPKKNARLLFLFHLLRLPASIAQKTINYFSTFIFSAFKCWKILHKEKVDLVHFNNTLLRPQEWILASLFSKAQVVAHERGINNKFPYQYRFWARYLKAIICISEAVRENLLRHGFPEEKLFLIYNGLDPNTFTATRDKTLVLQEFGLDKNAQLIGVVGNIKQWKGQDIAIRAMVHIKKRFPNLRCLLIGGSSQDDKEYFDLVRNLVKSEGLEDNIIFTGQRRDVPSLINILSVLIHTSVLPEPFGRVLLEGMAMGKPIITPNIGAGPEIVADGKTGLVVKSGDPKDLARAILYLLEAPQKAEQMGKAGRDRLEKHFHINLCVTKVVKIYTELLGE